jgi:hypothetical protein
MRATETALTLRTSGGAIEVKDPVVIHNLLFVRSDGWIDERGGFSYPRSLGAELEPMLPLPFPDYGINVA